MNARQRRKLFAGTGLVSMLVGGLMVLAPGAGAEETTPTLYGVYGDQGKNVNLKCQASRNQPDVNDGTRYNLRKDDLDNAPLSFAGLTNVVASFTTVEDTVPLQIKWTAPAPVELVLVKQSSYTAVYDVNGAMSGTVTVALPPDATPSAGGLSHVDFCGGATGPSLTVSKVVSGTPDPNAGYTLDVSRGDASVADDEAFGPNDPYTTRGAGIYAITEVSTGGADSTAWACYAGESKTAFASGTDTTIEQLSVTEADVRCVFTNTYETGQPRTGEIAVDKVVVGPRDPATQYRFTVDCGAFDLNGPLADGDDAIFTLTNAQQPWTQTGIPAGTSCTVTETDRRGAESVSYSPVNGQVVIAAGQRTTVTVTNTFPAPPIVVPDETVRTQSLRLVKRVIGAAPEAWTVDFAVDELEDSAQVSNVLGTAYFGDVDAGTYTITESDVTEAERSRLEDVTCVDGEGDGVPATLTEAGVATVDVGVGEDVVCTFTNLYTQVLPDVVTPATPQAPKPQPNKPEVKGVQVTRQLPRTGSETTDLAGFGAGLLLLGAGLVITSRARRFGIDA